MVFPRWLSAGRVSRETERQKRREEDGWDVRFLLSQQTLLLYLMGNPFSMEGFGPMLSDIASVEFFWGWHGGWSTSRL